MHEITIYKGSSYMKPFRIEDSQSIRSNPFISASKKSRLNENWCKKKSYINPKVITFDLDETLGSFGELYILWTNIHTIFSSYNSDDILFERLLDIYPEFLRTGILNILKYLYNKKLTGECSKVFLYTNNQCYGSYNSKWISFIIGYIHKKICSQKTILFDKIICAFKINNQIIEPLRTTNNKTYNDFIRCTLLPRSAEICFIDNTYFSKMLHNRVYYIQPRAYHHMLSQTEIINRFFTNYDSLNLPRIDYQTIEKWFSNNSIFEPPSLYNYTNEKQISDMIVSKKIMYHLKEFFLLSTKGKKTKKILLRLGKFTRKVRTF